MNINKELNGNQLTLAIEGRIDTKTAPELELVLKDSLSGVQELVFDFEQVAYISSAGLRVLLVAQKQMNAKGKMKVINANEDLMEIFEITGFADILTIDSSGKGV
jgi:anti-sigma B factor antagonist